MTRRSTKKTGTPRGKGRGCVAPDLTFPNHYKFSILASITIGKMYVHITEDGDGIRWLSPEKGTPHSSVFISITDKDTELTWDWWHW